MIIYLNGEYIPKSEATVSVDDRGFLFADGVYEVIRLYGGSFFEADAHFGRLEESLQKIRIGFDDVPGLAGVAERLLSENDVAPHADGTKLYVQVTRGAAPRSHRFPAQDTKPTVFVSVSPLHTDPRELEEGIAAITVGDQRWTRCDIKSIALLPNVLAHQRAIDEGAQEAIFIRDGMITEATHNSVMGVFEGIVATAPLSNAILPSITRRVVLELCEELGVPYREFPMSEEDLRRADELFVTGTASEVSPVVRVDGRQVSDGKPGPVTKRLQDAFFKRTATT